MPSSNANAEITPVSSAKASTISGHSLVDAGSLLPANPSVPNNAGSANDSGIPSISLLTSSHTREYARCFSSCASSNSTNRALPACPPT